MLKRTFNHISLLILTLVLSLVSVSATAQSLPDKQFRIMDATSEVA